MIYFLAFLLLIAGEIIVCGAENERISVIKCREYNSMKMVSALGLSLTPLVVKKTVTKCDNLIGLILGGEVAKKGEFPHMAAIGWSNFSSTDEEQDMWKCGGTLISENFVLTAAHCTRLLLSSGQSVSPDIVRLGDQNLRDEYDANHKDFKIAEIITHPNYTGRYVYNDIALLKLKDRVYFKKNIKPACLWQTRSFSNASYAIATGWGQVGDTAEPSTELLKVNITLIDDDGCQKYIPLLENRRFKQGLAESQLCAGDLSGEKDTCEGDSGGPLQLKPKTNDCIYNIIGITSFGPNCGSKNRPAIYTRVSSYIGWIESVVWEK